MDAKDDFWVQAMKGLPTCKFLRRPVPIAELDSQCQGRLKADWENLKAKMVPGDQIWPFKLDVRSHLGMRRGFLVLRCGKPIGGIVTLVS
jgi:hypothetical protein